MAQNKPKHSFIRLLKLIYLKLVRINDTPHKIALGLGLGVFTGIMPGMGPIASLFLAFIFRVNRAAALLGSMLTNTWISLVTFLLSIKVGSAIMKLDWRQVYQESRLFLSNFQWSALFKAQVFKVALPLIIGYLIISLCLGLIVYLVALTIIYAIKRWKKKRYSS